MTPLAGKIAVVTGASRGVGKGVAMALGAAGATVYITGRTVDESHPTVPLAGTIHQTAEAVTRLGGQGIAVRCDHHDDSQVEAVFRRVKHEQGRLDILVNNAWAGYEGYVDGRHLLPQLPFWQKPISFWDENLAGVRWAYVASWYAAPLLVANPGGLIANISFNPEPGNPAYGAAKAAVDRLTADIAHDLREHRVAAVSIYPGLVRTEGVILNAQYFDMSTAESPQFTGRAVVALAADPDLMQKSGRAFVVAYLARDYGFEDIDG
jgi:NAD(P)-dependent dehydrogenase (short-subunit alcohol dehydrogenase family)